MAPAHLSPAALLLDRFQTTPFEFVFSVPPRHGKTVLVLHFIVWALLRDPTLKIAYVSYSANQAEDMSGDALKVAERAGLILSRTTRGAWETPQGGKVHWVGVNGALTGKGYQIVIVDDPVKNRVEAESVVHRERAWNFFQSDLYTRLEAGGRNRIEPSVAVIQTRWHQDDLAGRLSRGDADEEVDPWHTINIPAIADEGTDEERALCEALVPLKRLKRIRRRVGPYSWASLYQGHPAPRGASVFGDPTFFTKEPSEFRAGLGLDLAYSAKKHADFSVVVTILREPPPDANTEARHYVVRVRRKQCKAPEFKVEVRQALSEHNGPIRFYATGPEEGTVDFIKSPPDPVFIDVLRPVGDKFTRSIPFAAAWNAGKVLIPAPELVAANPGKWGWVNDYLDELKVFTGVKDAKDDQVDASAAAYDVVAGPEATFESMADLGIEQPARRF